MFNITIPYLYKYILLYIKEFPVYQKILKLTHFMLPLWGSGLQKKTKKKTPLLSQNDATLLRFSRLTYSVSNGAEMTYCVLKPAHAH